MKTTRLPRLALICLIAPLTGASAQPVDNPVVASGIDLGGYDAAWVDTMVDWTNVVSTAAVANDGIDDLSTIQEEILDLSESGGGVLFFPAGTYNLSDTLYLAEGVVLRGVTPAESDARGSYTLDGLYRVYDVTYDPPSKFQFPIYPHNLADDMSWVGTKRHAYFKTIEVGKRDGLAVIPDASHSGNLGLVNIDIDGAVISISDRLGNDVSNNYTWGAAIPKNALTNRNILVFGNRLNNGTVLEPGIPQKTNQTSGSLVIGKKYMIAIARDGADFTNVGAADNAPGTVFTATGATPASWGSPAAQLWHYDGVPGDTRQNLWQIWPTRTRAKIDIMSAGNNLVANNVVGDKHYKRFVFNDGTQDVMTFQIKLNRAVDGPPPKPQQYLLDNGATMTSTSTEPVYTRFSDGYGIRLNHSVNYITAHTAIQEPSKHRDGIGIINNFVYATTRVGLMGAGNGLVIHNNVRVDYIGMKRELIVEAGNRAPNNSATYENRGIDVTGGHDVKVTGNYVQIRRGTFGSGYPTVDGEGFLLQESSSTMHPTNWLIQDNTLHSYIGIYRVIYTDGMEVMDNTLYNSEALFVSGARNDYMGRVSGNYPVIFGGNSAGSNSTIYNIKPRNLSIVDLGGNTPALSIQEKGSGSTNPGVELVDAVPGLEILYPRKSDLAGLSEGQVVTLRVKVTRHPDDVVAVAGVKAWDSVTNYPVSGTMSGDYWTYDGLTPGQPAGIALTLVEPDGTVDGGVYEGSWTVPAEFDKRGLLVAEIRLEPQATTLTKGTANTPLGPWTERNWAFVTGEAGGEATAPVGVAIAPAEGGVEISFPSLSGYAYQLEFSSNLQQWAPAGSPVSGDGTVLTLSDDRVATPGNPLYYRIEVTTGL